MTNKLLLPHRYKKIGWFFLIPSTILGIILCLSGFDLNWINAQVFAIFNAKTVEGTYLFASIAFIVCLLTDTLFARSSCVSPLMARSTLILFFMGHDFIVFIQNVIKSHNKDYQHGKHVVYHYI